MPIYEYRCENGHSFDALQKMSDEPLTECEQCGAPVERVFHPIAVHFKGSGFYNTDYGKQKRGKKSDSGEKSSSDQGKSDSFSSDKSSSEGGKSSSAKSSESSSRSKKTD